MNRKNGAFTLIELLVVIAIIVLLVGILVPSVRKALAIGQHAACRANLKGVGAAFRMYLNDSDDIMPEAAAMPSLNLGSDPGIAEVLKDQIGPADILKCPSDVGPDGTVGYYFKNESTSYFYLSMLGGRKVGEGFRGRRGPDKMHIMRDMEPFHGEAGEYGSTNYLFMDGSVGDLIDSEAQEFEEEVEKEEA